MTWADTRREIVLAIYPSSRGFGWIALEGPFAVVESGLHQATKDKNAGCVRALDRLIRRIKPSALVLEAFDKRSSVRSGRIRRLCLSFVTLAADRGLELAVYTRDEVRAAFASVEAYTRDETAEAVAKALPAIAHRLPKKRGAGDSEDKRLSVFNAAAVALTHYGNGATALLDELRDAA